MLADSPDPRPPRRFAVRSLVPVFANAILCYPVVLCLALYTEWFVAWATLGHAPRPMLDDPKSIVEVHALHRLVGILLMGYLPTAVAAVALATLDAVWNRPAKRTTVLRLAAVAVLWALFIALMRWDPGQVVEWWFD